ncbi:MAG: hypothetical protein WC789_03290 [Lentisphaeria bacterium]
MLLALAAWLAVPWSLASAERPDSGAAVHVLDNGVLRVEVMDPSHPQRYNRGVRFTPVAAVLGVRQDGKEFLFYPVKHDPVADHAGLAAEFDMVAPGEPDAWMPPGYLEAKVGEGFVKIGVGVLRKERGRYSLFQQPALLAPAVTTAEWQPAGAVFRQTCAGVNGYAYELRADLTVAKNRVVVAWTLMNTGRKPVTTRQYTHNFFRLGARDTGAGCVLEFPHDFQATGLEAQQRQVGREIRFLAPIPQWVNLVVPYPPEYAGPNRCTLRRSDMHQSVTCETSMPGLRTAVHARPEYVSPEQFIRLQVAPGKCVTWTRSYEFASGKSRE